MKKLLYNILLISSFMFASCSQNSLISEVSNTLQGIYYEDANISGFKNIDTDIIDSFTTYRAMITNDFFKCRTKVNNEKLKYFILQKLKDMTLGDRLSRDLMDEKYTIDMLDYLNIKLDNDLQQKIITALDQHIFDESKKVPDGDQNSLNINRQHKSQIHYNYLYIAKKLHINVSPKTRDIIINNLNEVETHLIDVEKKSIKANYYRYMLRVYLGLPIEEKFKEEITENINNLQLLDGGFTYLPVDNHNSSQKSDIFSSRLAVEVLYSLFENKLIHNKDLNNYSTKNYLLNYYQETELKNHKSTATLIEIYEMVSLFKLIGIYNIEEL